MRKAKHMPGAMAINGTRLDEVRMPMKPHTKGVISSLSYPMSQIHFSQNRGELCLAIPAYLAVELYRIGILPQDVSLPVEISIDGRSSGWFKVSDVRYPDRCNSPFGEVAFTLTRVVQSEAGSVPDAPPAARSKSVAERTYVMDITHYLDETGEMARLPGPAKKLASFLTLLIEAATKTSSPDYQDSGIRCRTKACRSTMLTMLPPGQGEILWHCPSCGHNGVIRNWQLTKWNQQGRSEQLD